MELDEARRLSQSVGRSCAQRQTLYRWMALAGIESARALERHMLGKRIECEFRGKDRHGRSIGLCRADGLDLGATMVGDGMAGPSRGTAPTTWSRRGQPSAPGAAPCARLREGVGLASTAGTVTVWLVLAWHVFCATPSDTCLTLGGQHSLNGR
jgi:hypothetical protein